MSKRLLLLPCFLLLFVSVFAITQRTHAQTQCPTPTSGTSVTTTVTIPQDGTYKVWSRVAAPNQSVNSYFLQIDNGCAMVIGDSSSIPANIWTWVGYQDGLATKAATVALTAGEHTVKLIEREGGLGIDRVLFSADLTCVPIDMGETCVSPTPTAVPPTNTPTPIATSTPIPTPAPSMTVTDITMSYTRTGGNKRNVKTTITVKNEQTGAAVANATVRMSLRAPSGNVSTFSGGTNSSGQVSFTKSYNKETGTFQATVTSVTKSGLIYHPTNTVKTLIVN